MYSFVSAKKRAVGNEPTDIFVSLSQRYMNWPDLAENQSLSMMCNT